MERDRPAQSAHRTDVFANQLASLSDCYVHGAPAPCKALEALAIYPTFVLYIS